MLLIELNWSAAALSVLQLIISVFEAQKPTSSSTLRYSTFSLHVTNLTSWPLHRTDAFRIGNRSMLLLSLSSAGSVHRPVLLLPGRFRAGPGRRCRSVSLLLSPSSLPVVVLERELMHQPVRLPAACRSTLVFTSVPLRSAPRLRGQTWRSMRLALRSARLRSLHALCMQKANGIENE